MLRVLIVCAGAVVLIALAWFSWPRVAEVGARSDGVFEPTAASPADRVDSQLDAPAESDASARALADLALTHDPLPELIVGGRVVDPEGAPIVGAEVTLSETDERGVSSTNISTGPKKETTRSDGSFEFRGRPMEARGTVSAWKDGYCRRDDVAYVRGDASVRIVLALDGVVTGRTIADAEFPLDAIEVILECLGPSRDGEKPVRARLPRKLASDGSFSFDGICTEEARLLFQVEGAFMPPITVDEIRVRETGASPDPRVDPIDLRASWHLLTIDVLEPSNGKCEGAMVALRDAQRGVVGRPVRTKDGRARFVVPTGPYDLQVELMGFRRELIASVSNDTTVRLRDGIPVRVVLDGQPTLPGAPYRLEVGLFVVAQLPSDPVDGLGSFGENGEAAFRVSSPGRHVVSWFVASPSARRWLTGLPQHEVQVLDQVDEQRIDLALEPEVRAAWEATIRELAAQR